jgi:hypothetical protein
MNLHSHPTNATRGQSNSGLLGKHGSLDKEPTLDIDWKATRQAMAKVSTSRRHWVSKQFLGFLWYPSDDVPLKKRELQIDAHV